MGEMFGKRRRRRKEEWSFYSVWNVQSSLRNTHHRSAVFHQVDSNDTQKCSKTQLEAQRAKNRNFQKGFRVFEVENVRCLTVTHNDSGVISSHGNVVCARGRDQTYSEHHQSQSQQSHGHPQGRLPPTQVLNFVWERQCGDKSPNIQSKLQTHLVRAETLLHLFLSIDIQSAPAQSFIAFYYVLL